MWLAAYPACRLWRPRGRRYDPHNQPPLSPSAHHSRCFGRPNSLNSALSCDCCQRQHAALCASLRLHPPSSFLSSPLSCSSLSRPALCGSLGLRPPSSSTGRGGLRPHWTRRASSPLRPYPHSAYEPMKFRLQVNKMFSE